jgi:hypothetical protein
VTGAEDGVGTVAVAAAAAALSDETLNHFFFLVVIEHGLAFDDTSAFVGLFFRRRRLKLISTRPFITLIALRFSWRPFLLLLVLPKNSFVGSDATSVVRLGTLLERMRSATIEACWTTTLRHKNRRVRLGACSRPLLFGFQTAITRLSPADNLFRRETILVWSL